MRSYGGARRGPQSLKRHVKWKQHLIYNFVNNLLPLLKFDTQIIYISQILTMSFTTTATIASFGGKLLKLTHDVSTTGCEMALNVYLPPNAGATSQKVPVLIYLSGLTCTGDNCAEKGFFQYSASKKGIAIVYPDTSPRTFIPSPLPPRD